MDQLSKWNLHEVDLRSDTVTKPTKEMREMALTAAVGDDVFGEDPSVNDLQKKVAELLGKESALFVPSGTMSNLISVMTHCWGRGCSVILGDQSHINLNEQGGIAQIGGVHPKLIKNLDNGTFSLEDMKRMVLKDNPHYSITSLVCIENSHNRMGGRVLPLQWIDELFLVCEKLGLPVHVDGARLFNAAVALNVPPSRLVRGAASVNICLSKGLGSPVGSLVVGSHAFIQRAVRIRKVLGGGMRQSGILAAMGSLAIDSAVPTIQRDHENLGRIVKAITDLQSDVIRVETAHLLTNILIIHCDSGKMNAEELCHRLDTCSDEELNELGVGVRCRLFAVSETAIRLVVHRDLTDQDIQRVIQKITYVISQF